MVRLFRFLLFALALASATLIQNYVFAQGTATPTPTLSPLNIVSGTPTLTPNSSEITGMVGVAASDSEELTATTTITSAPGTGLLPTPTALPAASVSAEITSPLTISDTIGSDGPLEGTILSNRSENVARFFLEGQTYQLAAGRSQGINLPRATTVLNLFNCDGELAVDTAGCYWDPYLIQQDGFYEIYDASTSTDQANLMLREAGAPPTGQVWVQNRTGQTESVVFKDEVHEIQPTSVLEFPVSTGVPAILYVRSCLTVDNQSACEWAPKTLNAGVYYAMIESDTPGAQSGSTRSTIDLRPVVGEGEAAEEGESESEGGEDPATAAIAATGPSIICSVVVPALNIRSGPGLQYDIIGKVRTTDGSAGTVNVTGRSADNEWLTVDPTVVENGWINNSPSFITCSTDVGGLPIAEAPATPTPQPAAVVESPQNNEPSIVVVNTPAVAEEGAAPAEETGEAAPEGTPTAPAIPDGQAVLVVNNGFQHEMRFTLDQMYRPQDGPSEFDLQPGQSLSIVVFPGDIPFTASTPWSGLSSNASVNVAANQSLTLWLRFEPEQGGNWVFRWN